MSSVVFNEGDVRHQVRSAVCAAPPARYCVAIHTFGCSTGCRGCSVRLVQRLVE